LADQIGVEASKAVHVGDDETADKAGANAIGLECWYAIFCPPWFLPRADIMFQYVAGLTDWLLLLSPI
jgi:FMN phosphatase YigB (HAD superfamily)